MRYYKVNLELYEWFSMYTVHFGDESCNIHSFDVLFRKAEWRSCFQEGDLGGGMPASKLDPMLATDPFRSTSVEQTMVVKDKGGVGSEVGHSLD